MFQVSLKTPFNGLLGISYWEETQWRVYVSPWPGDTLGTPMELKSDPGFCGDPAVFVTCLWMDGCSNTPSTKPLKKITKISLLDGSSKVVKNIKNISWTVIKV